MRIVNHRVKGLTFQKAHYTGEVITPEIVILHDTAGRLAKGNSAAFLASANTAKASVHFVIERDGSIVQQVPTNRRANHAGASSYNGRSGCNAFSLGIELVNPGLMTRWSDTMALAWWGEQLAVNLYGIREVTTKEHGRGLWMPHAQEQIEALIRLLEVLFRDVKSLRDITTHWYVSPGRKVDPNPLLPLDAIRARIFGAEDPADLAAEAGSSAVQRLSTVQVNVGNGDTLNMRRWPSFNPNVIATIPNGAQVSVVRSGQFDGRWWYLARYGGSEGWIVAEPYTSEIREF